MNMFFKLMLCSRCYHDFSRLQKKWGEGGGGGRKGYMFFKDFMVSKYLKNRDLMKQRIDVYIIYNFLNLWSRC